jgi:hypothetical protein
VLIQSAIVVLVVLYYTVPSAQAVGEVIGEWKAKGGLWFPALSTALAAGLLPEVARLAVGGPRSRPFTAGELAFQLAYFGFLGVLIDRLYWVLGVLFGDNPSVGVVLIKTACDLIVFAGVISMPLAVFLFAWKDTGFRIGRTLQMLSRGEFMRRYVPTLVLCWLFWAPVLAALYALPVSLQFMMALLAEAAWALLIVHMATHPVPEHLE